MSICSCQDIFRSLIFAQDMLLGEKLFPLSLSFSVQVYMCHLFLPPLLLPRGKCVPSNKIEIRPLGKIVYPPLSNDPAALPDCLKISRSTNFIKQGNANRRILRLQN